MSDLVRLDVYVITRQIARLRAEAAASAGIGKRADMSVLVRDAIDLVYPPKEGEMSKFTGALPRGLCQSEPDEPNVKTGFSVLERQRKRLRLEVIRKRDGSDVSAVFKELIDLVYPPREEVSIDSCWVGPINKIVREMGGQTSTSDVVNAILKLYLKPAKKKVKKS